MGDAYIRAQNRVEIGPIMRLVVHMEGKRLTVLRVTGFQDPIGHHI